MCVAGSCLSSSLPPLCPNHGLLSTHSLPPFLLTLPPTHTSPSLPPSLPPSLFRCLSSFLIALHTYHPHVYLLLPSIFDMNERMLLLVTATAAASGGCACSPSCSLYNSNCTTMHTLLLHIFGLVAFLPPSLPPSDPVQVVVGDGDAAGVIDDVVDDGAVQRLKGKG